MIKVGILGVGRIFNKHYTSIKSIKNFEIISVCDTNKKKKKIVSKINKKIFFYKDYKKMITNHTLDLLVICTPSGLHAQQALFASKHIKNIIIEKPLSISLKEAFKLKQIETKKKCNFFVVKQNRLNKSIKFLKEIYENKTLGEIIYLSIKMRWNRDLSYFKQAKWRGKWKLDGGILGNQASHYLDLLTWLVKSEFEYVSAISGTSISSIEAPDTIIANLKFKNGVFANIETTTAAKPENIEGSISVFGKNGSIIIGGKSANKIDHFFSENRHTFKKKINSYSEFPTGIYGNGHQRFYNEVNLFLKKKKKNNEFSIINSIHSIKLMHAIYQSSNLKKTIFNKKNVFFYKMEK